MRRKRRRKYSICRGDWPINFKILQSQYNTGITIKRAQPFNLERHAAAFKSKMQSCPRHAWNTSEPTIIVSPIMSDDALCEASATASEPSRSCRGWSRFSEKHRHPHLVLAARPIANPVEGGAGGFCFLRWFALRCRRRGACINEPRLWLHIGVSAKHRHPHLALSACPLQILWRAEPLVFAPCAGLLFAVAGEAPGSQHSDTLPTSSRMRPAPATESARCPPKA
mmetsp:Transcript_29598/g.98066  ORF Transcript_29598/g.98066 Transcript_29598/m.98066 type:complete len:225 (+) Transcript_29598:331-1005(+)